MFEKDSKLLNRDKIENFCLENETKPILFIGFHNDSGRGGQLVFDRLYESLTYHRKTKIVGVISNSNSICRRFAIPFIHVLNRSLKNLKWKEGGIVILISTHLIDLLLAILIKLFRRNVKISAPFYHLIPADIDRGDWKMVLLILSQQIRLKLSKWIIDLITTENTYIKNIIKENTGKEAMVYSTGISQKFFPKLEDLPKPTERDIDLLYLGAIDKPKGIIDFLKIAKGALERNKFLKIAIVGFDRNNFLYKYLEEVGLPISENLLIHTNASDQVKFGILSRSKLLVYTSYVDGIPIAFYEAMAYCVVVSAFFLETYIDLKNRFINIETRKTDEFVEKVVEILTNYRQYYELYSKENYEIAGAHLSEIVLKREVLNICQILISQK